MLANKKTTNIGSTLFVNEPSANVDYKYGPYASLDEAYTHLAHLDIIAVGLTIGILTDTGIVEYWFKNGTSKNDLVLKGIDPSITEEIKTLKEDNAKLQQMLSTEDLDGNGIPDGEDRLLGLEEAVREEMTEEDVMQAWNSVFNKEK